MAARSRAFFPAILSIPTPFRATENRSLSRWWTRSVTPASGWREPTVVLLRHASSPASEDSPKFLPDGDIVFRALENGSNFLFLMKPDGSNRHKVLAERILDFNAVSPDGRWVVFGRPISGAENPAVRSAFSMDSHQKVDVCWAICGSDWDALGTSMVFGFQKQTFIVPVMNKTGLPQIPAGGFAGPGDFKQIPGARTVDKYVLSVASPSIYAYQVDDIRRNLYRIPLP